MRWADLNPWTWDDEKAQDAEYAKLLDRRSQVVSLLRSVRSQIKLLDRRPLSQDATGEEAACQEKYSGTRIGGFSWRAEELARRLFEAFDCDGDGRLDFVEFGNYAAAVGLADVSQEEEEAEKKYCDDEAPWRSLKTWAEFVGDDETCSWSRFLRHRKRVEPSRPIEADALRALGSNTPAKLEEWRFVSETFDEIDAAEATRRAAGPRRRRVDPEAPAGWVPVEAFQYLCGRCGAYFTQGECDMTLKLAHDRSLVCQHIRDRFRRGLRCASNVDAEIFSDSLYKDAFLAWWFSGRNAEEPPFFERSALQWVVSTQAVLRGLQAAADTLRSKLERLTSTGFLDLDETKIRAQRDPAKYECVVEVTPVDALPEDLCDSDGGATLEATIGYLPHLERYSSEKRLPGGTGSSIVVDFAVRADADASILWKLKAAFEKLLAESLDPELRRLCGYYAGYRVLVLGAVNSSEEKKTNASSSSEKQKKTSKEDHITTTRAVRLQILWRAEGCIDDWFARYTGVPFSEIVRECEVSVRSSASLGEMLTKTALRVGHDVSGRLEVKASWARHMLVHVAEELLYREAEIETLAERDRVEKLEAFERARQRSLASHGQLLRPGELPEAGITGHAAPVKTRTALDDAQKKETLREIRALARRCLAYAKITKTLQMEVRFKSLLECLDSAFVQNVVPANVVRFLRSLLREPGGVAVLYARFAAVLADELDAHWRDVERAENATESRANAKAQRDADAYAKLSDTEKKRRDFAQKVRALQAELSGLDGGRAQSSSDSSTAESLLDMLQRLDSEHSQSLRLGLDFYALATTALAGPTNISCQSGKLHLNLDLDGLDLLPFLP